MKTKSRKPKVSRTMAAEIAKINRFIAFLSKSTVVASHNFAFPKHD